MTTTAATIRDTCLTVIEALTPRSLAADRFERHRADACNGATFEEWLTSSTDQLRRVVMRDTGVRTPPLVSNADVVRERVTFVVAVSYPVSNRYGDDGGRDLHDVIDEDQRQIDHAIGLHGSANIPTDAVYLTEFSSWDRMVLGETYVLLVGTMAYEFWRSAP
jgi:hypothetical protein